MADELKVVVSADARQLEGELKKAENNLRAFEAALKKSTNVDEINYLTRSVGLLKDKISTLKGSFQDVSKFSNTATQSLSNLGRVVQDAPFGFIGIANNINPLLESFQRLQAETGSTSTALKALGSSFLGAGGLGFAISAATSLLLVFGTNLTNTAEKTEPVAKGIDEIAEAAKKAKKDVDALGAAFDFALQQANGLAQINFGGTFQGRLLIEQQKSYSLLKQISDLDDKALELKEKINKERAKENVNIEELTKLTTQQKEIENALSKLYDERDLQFTRIRVLRADELRDLDKIKKKEKEIKDIQYEVFRVRPLPNISQNEIINFQDELAKELDKGVNSLPGVITVPAEVKLVGSKQFNDEINAKVFKPAENFSAELLTAVQGTINVLLDGISQAFSGDVGGGLNSIFKGLLSVVGDFLIQLGLAAIGIGKLYAAIKGGQFNPQLTIAAGIASLVLGAVLKAFIPKFATGTRFAPGGTALVGERGPELVSLPEGARVTPAAQTGAILGGAMQSIQVYGVMRGRDIYFTNQRYGNSFNVGT